MTLEEIAAEASAKMDEEGLSIPSARDRPRINEIILEAIRKAVMKERHALAYGMEALKDWARQEAAGPHP